MGMCMCVMVFSVLFVYLIDIMIKYLKNFFQRIKVWREMGSET